MSGPKVVRIVTREELRVIAQGQIASLAAALENWKRVGNRNDVIEAEDIRLAERRVATMHELLARDEFGEIRRQVPLEVGFLKMDMAKRIERAAEKAAEGRRQDRRRLRAVEALTAALQQRGIPLLAGMADAKNLSQDALQAVANSALALLAPQSATTGPTANQLDLAKKLSDGSDDTTLAQWMELNDISADHDPALLNVERRLEELRAIDPSRANGLQERFNLAVSDYSARRSLILDSLAADIADARWAAVADANAWEELNSLEAQLHASTAGDTFLALLSEITALRKANASAAALSEVTATARAALEQFVKDRTEADRRRVVLDGLAELGYQVNPGMETAWVENGRIVLRSSKSSSYGVELGGNPGTNMQLRTVGFVDAASPADRNADVAAETEFCDDFAALQKRVASQGSELSVIKALGVGAVAVKRVQTDHQENEEESRSAAPSSAKTLR